jgi:hypothetical protein
MSNAQQVDDDVALSDSHDEDEEYGAWLSEIEEAEVSDPPTRVSSRERSVRMARRIR